MKVESYSSRRKGLSTLLPRCLRVETIFLLAALVLTLSLVVLLPAQDLSLPDNPLRGRFVFEQKGCINCHAINGQGGSIGPDLGSREFYGTLLELASIMWNHSPEMFRRMRELDLPFPMFSESEMTELIAFLYFQRYLGEPGDLYRGRVLVREKGCLSCHSIGGKGGDSAPAFDELAKYISPLFMAQALWNHGPAMDREIERKGLSRPTFESGEIVDLSAYIRSASAGTVRERVYMTPGNPRRGLQVLRQKNCLTCHSTQGDDGTVGPDFGRMEWNLSVTEIAGLMWNHGSQMAQMMAEMEISWPTFSGREISDLISYLYFQGFRDESGDSTLGRQLFVDKGCAGCHDLAGENRGSAPNLSRLKTLSSPAAMAPVMWNHAPSMEEKVAEKKPDWPHLNGVEMSHLYAFLREQSSSHRELR